MCSHPFGVWIGLKDGATFESKKLGSLEGDCTTCEAVAQDAIRYVVLNVPSTRDKEEPSTDALYASSDEMD